MIPFYNRIEELKSCIKNLFKEIKHNGIILLINDGSDNEIKKKIINYVKNYNNVKLIHHKKNYGVAAARNTGVDWCRANNIDIIIMIDSDSITKQDCIYHHLSIHKKNPDISIIGGGIIGKANSFFGRLDGVLSWVHSMPYSNWHEVKKPYHLPTNNLSLKLNHFKNNEKLFPEFLKTGEDAFFIKEAQKNGKHIFFSPNPQITHLDRNTLKEVLHHHFEWGHHQYFIITRWNNFYFSFNPIFRLSFFIFFIFAFIFYVFLGTFLNIYPWIKYKTSYIIYAPFIFLLWFLKAFAVFHACLNPESCTKSIKFKTLST